jgi:hypothetical protein
MLVGASFSTVFILKHYTLNGVIKTGAEKMWGFVEQIADCDFGSGVRPDKTIHEQHEVDSCEFVDQFARSEKHPANQRRESPTKT